MNSVYTACSKNGSSTTHLHTNIPSQLQCRKEAVLSTTGRQDDTEAGSIRFELGHFILTLTCVMTQVVMQH